MTKNAFLSGLVYTFMLIWAANGYAASSNWQDVMGGSVRLLTSGPPENGTYLAGAEFSLEDGWHTYWKYPGEAGIAPEFDFSGSRNVANVDVFFPTPERYDDGFSTSIVYENGIVLPLKITPINPSEPIHLSAQMFFGICSDLCVPGEASLSLALDPNSDTDMFDKSLIERDLATVPRASSDQTPNVSSIELKKNEKGSVLRITAELTGEGTTKPELFADGGEGSYIGVPKLVSLDGTSATWELSTVGLHHADGTASLNLVLVDGKQSVEGSHLIPFASQ